MPDEPRYLVHWRRPQYHETGDPDEWSYALPEGPHTLAELKQVLVAAYASWIDFFMDGPDPEDGEPYYLYGDAMDVKITPVKEG